MSRHSLILSILAVVLAAALAAHAGWYRSWIVDDAAISFSYAASWVDSGQYSLQVGGEQTEGFSNPLWVWILGASMGLGLFHPVWTPKLLGFLLLAASVALVLGFVRRRTGRSPLAGTGLALALALDCSWVAWGMSGLENALYGFLIVAALVSMSGQPSSMRGVMVGLLALGIALTRPEGIVYATLLLAIWIARGAWMKIRDASSSLHPLMLAGAILAFGGALFLLWRWTTFHDLLPNPSYAKLSTLPDLQETLSGKSRGARYVLRGLDVGVWKWFTLAIPLLLFFRWRDHRAWTMALAFGVSIAFPVLAQGDWMMGYRFLTPTYTILFLITAWALAEVEKRSGRRGPILAALLATTAVIYSIPSTINTAPAFAESPTLGMEEPAVAVSRYRTWADVLGQPSISVAVPDLGGSSFVGRTKGIRIVDIAGLCDRFVGRIGRHEGMRDYILDRRKPEVIGVHDNWSVIANLHGDPRFQADYMPTWERRGMLERIAPDKPELREGIWVRRDFVLVDSTLVSEPVADETGRHLRARGLAPFSRIPSRDGSLTPNIVFEVLNARRRPAIELRVFTGATVVASGPVSLAGGAYQMHHGRAGDFVPAIVTIDEPDGGWPDGARLVLQVRRGSQTVSVELGEVDREGASPAINTLDHKLARLAGTNDIEGFWSNHSVLARLSADHSTVDCACAHVAALLGQIGNEHGLEQATQLLQSAAWVPARARALREEAAAACYETGRDLLSRGDIIAAAQAAWPWLVAAVDLDPPNSRYLVASLDVARLASQDWSHEGFVRRALSAGDPATADPWQKAWEGLASSPWPLHAWRLRSQVDRVRSAELPPAPRNMLPLVSPQGR